MLTTSTRATTRPDGALAQEGGQRFDLGQLRHGRTLSDAVQVRNCLPRAVRRHAPGQSVSW
jgi:hypothetical protein